MKKLTILVMFTTVFLGCNSLENTKPETNNTNESTSSDLLSLIPPQDDIYGLIQIKSVCPLGKSNYSYSVFGYYFDKAMQDDNKNFRGDPLDAYKILPYESIKW